MARKLLAIQVRKATDDERRTMGRGVHVYGTSTKQMTTRVSKDPMVTILWFDGDGDLSIEDIVSGDTSAQKAMLAVLNATPRKKDP